MLVLRSCHCVQRYLLDLKRCLIFSTKHGHGIWANVPASDKYGTPTTHWTWLHVCPNHFFFLKMMNMVGTQLGHDLCPKRKLKCIVPLMTISSHTNLLLLLLLLLLQFLDLFLFYGFSPFTLFPWFVRVCLLLFCLPHNHTWRDHLYLTSTWTKDVRLVLLFKYLSFMFWSPPPIQPAS